MKLPGITYVTPVKPLGREDPAAYARAVEAEVSATLAGGELGAQVGQAVSGAADMTYEWLQERELFRTDVDYNKEVAKEKVRSEAKEFYTPDEIPPEIEVDAEVRTFDEKGDEVTTARDQIPSEEVYPELYKERMTKVVDTLASRMAFADSRERWRALKLAEVEETYAGYKAASLKALRAKEKLADVSAIQNFVDLKMYDEASEVSRGSQYFSREERQAHAILIKEALEKDQKIEKEQVEQRINNHVLNGDHGQAAVEIEYSIHHTDEEKEAFRIYNDAQQKDQQKRFWAEQEEKIKSQMATRDFSGAKINVYQSNFESAKETEWIQEIDRENERTRYHDQVDTGNVAGMEDMYKFLSQSYSDYRKAGGKLDETEKASMRRYLKQNIEEFKSLETQVRTERKALKTRDANTFSQAMEEGDLLPKQSYEHLAEDEEVSATARARLAEAEANQNNIRKIYVSNPINHEKIIDQTYGDKTSARMIRMKEAAQKASDRMQGELDKNVIEVAKKAGLWDDDQYAMDWRNPGESIARRVEVVRGLREHYGRFTGYLTSEEADQFASDLSRMEPEQALDVITALQSALGSEAQHVYDQLELGTSAGRFAVAGRLNLENKRTVALEVLYGPEVYEKFKGIADVTTIRSEFQDALAGALQGNPVVYQGTLNGMVNAYLTRAGADGKLSKTTESSIIESVVRDFLGGEPIRIGDLYIVPPVDGMTENEFERWIAAIPDHYFTQYGKINGYTPIQVRSQLLTGDLRLRQINRTTFVIDDPHVVVNGVPTSRGVTYKDGTPVIIEYYDISPDIIEYANKIQSGHITREARVGM